MRKTLKLQKNTEKTKQNVNQQSSRLTNRLETLGTELKTRGYY